MESVIEAASNRSSKYQWKRRWWLCWNGYAVGRWSGLAPRW